MLKNLSKDERRIHRIDINGVELERGPSGKRVKIINGKKIGGKKEITPEEEDKKECMEEDNTQENSVNLTIENGEATIKNLEDTELESDGVQFYTGDVQTKELQKYKMLLKTTSKETLILDKNNQPIKKMGEGSIVFAKPEIIEKDGKNYYQTVVAEKVENSNIKEGVDPLSGDIYVDGMKYTKGYVNADYIVLLREYTDLER